MIALLQDLHSAFYIFDSYLRNSLGMSVSDRTFIHSTKAQCNIYF